MASFPQSSNREAGLPDSFCWQELTSSEGPENLQVVEQAQASRWSLSTAGTPLQGIFPSNSRSFTRSKLAASTSTSDLHAKSPYDDPGRKRALLSIFRRNDPCAKKDHPLVVTIGIHEKTTSPTCIIQDNSNAVASPAATPKRWKRREKSLGKIVTYPTKIFGKILPRWAIPKDVTVAAPSLPDKSLKVFLEVPGEPKARLRRAETTIRRPKRSIELERLNEPMNRWSMASTQAIRSQRFSFEPKNRSWKTPPDGTCIHSATTPPPFPALTRSMTQPGSERREQIPHSESPRKPSKRSRSERHKPHSTHSSPFSQRTSSETVATIADRIVAKEPHQRDDWEFLDYYSQSSMLVNP
ncbi:hypothetical protein J3R30DRAFT_3694153 [Lentinula aciculospora]|uniref:Uncharacterized protein n=1 Tax=Lentinula aciculospora TaxID=153920 RepID=A0A9W9AU10_9AGAR|nr:hypothetical protein J3R30DRAFT_3694153 [Lentinula aciculospora]